MRPGPTVPRLSDGVLERAILEPAPYGLVTHSEVKIRVLRFARLVERGRHLNMTVPTALADAVQRLHSPVEADPTAADSDVVLRPEGPVVGRFAPVAVKDVRDKVAPHPQHRHRHAKEQRQR